MISLSSRSVGALQRKIDAAQGKISCDLVIEHVNYLDVFSCEWRQGSIGIIDGMIVGLEAGLKAPRMIDGRGQWLVPGFIDAHVHVESSLLTPWRFEQSILFKGTTTAICDPHEIANVLGVKGIQYFLDASTQMNLDLKIMLSSCVPATLFETNGGGIISAPALVPFMNHPQVLGLAEMMNVPGVLNGDADILEKISMFAGAPMDGHCPLVRGQALSAYASTGISSCHESSELEEAQEKLTKGISVWIREGSVAKDLHALAPLLTLATSTSIGFCTDDRNPLDIAREGHIDFLIRQSIALGVTPEVAYRASSWSVARHYGLKNKGAIAPGYVADLVLLNDEKKCSIKNVFLRGQPVSEVNFKADTVGRTFINTVRAADPQPQDLAAPTGRVHVIGVNEGKIITEHFIQNHNDLGVARLSVLARHGSYAKPANAYVRGFGEHLNGAIASSVGHDSHNLIVVGSNAEDMCVALKALVASGGGFCVVSDSSVKSLLALPIAGLMSEKDASEVEVALIELHRASQSIGCILAEPFLQLAFLSLPVIPSLKLTDRGLIDVNQFKLIDVRAS